MMMASDVDKDITSEYCRLDIKAVDHIILPAGVSIDR